MVASRNKVCKCVRISRYLTSILICSQLPTLVIFLVSKRFMEPLGILVALLGCKRVMRLRVKRHLQQFVVLLCIKIAFLLQYFQRTETAVSAPFVILNYSRTGSGRSHVHFANFRKILFTFFLSFLYGID